MKRYRGFEGEISTLGCADCPDGLGALRTYRNGGREAYFLRRRTEPIKPPTEPAPILQPSTAIVAPADQELEKRQYSEGGDGRAELLEVQAKIDEAIKRATDGRVTTPTVAAPEVETPNWLPLAIGAGLIWIMK